MCTIKFIFMHDNYQAGCRWLGQLTAWKFRYY